MTHGPVHPGAMATAETVSPALTVPRSVWRRDTTLLLMVLGALTALFWATATSLVMSWAGDPLAHGYIIIPAVGYLAWHRRHLPGDVAPTSEWLAISAVTAFAAVWFVANLSDSVSVQQFCFVAIVIGFVPVVLGSAQARLLVFPLGLLLFGLPLGTLVIPLLARPDGQLRRQAAVVLARSGPAPGTCDLHPRGRLEGRRSVQRDQLPDCLVSPWLPLRWRHLPLLAPPRSASWQQRRSSPSSANGLRVYGTILLAYLAGPQSVEGTRHYSSAGLFFR